VTPALVLTVSSGVEVAIGLALMIAPEASVPLLLGSRLGAVGIPVGHVTGIALLCLGIACWPYSKVWSGKTPALIALVIYNLLVATYLAYLGKAGEYVGLLLWPAVALHALIGTVLVLAWLRANKVAS
jgi:xanthine/uracil permease